MKRALALLLTAVLLLSGCGREETPPLTTAADTVPVQTVPETTAQTEPTTAEPSVHPVFARLEETEAEAATLYEKLMNDPNLTQADMNDLSMQIYQVWDDLLNEIWKQLQEVLPPEEMQQLTVEERQWINRKEESIQRSAAVYSGGSLAGMAANQRGADLTRRQVYYLASVLTGDSSVALDNCSDLFEFIFLSAGYDGSGLSLDDFLGELAIRGYSYIEEAGVVLVYDPQMLDSYIRAHIDYSGDRPMIHTLNYCLTIRDVQRQVEIRNLNEKDGPTYYTNITPYHSGTQVESVEVLAAFLNAPLVEREPLEPALIRSALIQNVFLPAAKGTLSLDTEAFREEMLRQGFLCQEGEGQFWINDPENPGSSLFGQYTYEEGITRIAGFGYHLVDGDEHREVRVDLFDRETVFYIDAGTWDGGVEVSTVEAMEAYLNGSE